MITRNLKLNVLSPEEYKKMQSFSITYGCMETKFGNCLLGLHDDRICFLTFYDSEYDMKALSKLHSSFPKAIFTENNAKMAEYVNKIFDNNKKELNLLLIGTEFQVNVWKELMEIEEGSTTSYEDLAQKCGNVKAVRAVANTVANNKISYIIPCHRIIRKSGEIGNYGGGIERKRKMLKYENVLIE